MLKFTINLKTKKKNIKKNETKDFFILCMAVIIDAKILLFKRHIFGV